MKNPEALRTRIRAKIDGKTKPPGSLGKLEGLAAQIGEVLGTETPKLKAETLIVFAADHGLAAEGVSPFPAEVTHQMVLNFLAGGAAINAFAKSAGWRLMVVDAGVNFRFEKHPQLVDLKIGFGTANALHEPAMTEAQCRKAMDAGGQLVEQLAAKGCNLVAFGEMGIGNTSAASLIMHGVTGLALEQCVGRGTGHDDPGIQRKRNILENVILRHGVPRDPKQIMQFFGGFELAMICGGMLAAARNQMIVLVDGFIVTAALLIAAELNPEVKDHCVYAHCSGEKGHRAMLDWLNGTPLLELDLRLGEGTGAALALPLLRSAVAFLNEMASFESAGVSEQN